MRLAGTAVFCVMLFGCLLPLTSAAGSSDELLPPLKPAEEGVIDNPAGGLGCNLPAPGPIRKSLLVVRDTLRSDVGPYSVSLPGYATNPGGLTQDSYRPYLITATPGDTLRIDLINRLGTGAADNLINLHTHGLIVSPRPYLPCQSPGDYVFDQIGPNQIFRYRIDIPTEVLGTGVAGRLPFLSGVYWFHSHVHGSSKNQVQAGQAGVIALAPLPAPIPSAAALDPTSAIRAATDERFLVLRDIQLGVSPGQTPAKRLPEGQAAQWRHGDDYDSQACRQASNPNVKVSYGKGFCSHPTVSNGDGTIDKTVDLVWLFTINGQLNPTITVAPGRTQLWRVANLSATVAYTLDMVDPAGTEQGLRLLTLDGVVAGTSEAADAGRLYPSVVVKRVLLMPGSRAEILVENTNRGQTDNAFVLRTLGLETGGVNSTANRADYVGDPWPQIDLATVIVQGRGPPSGLSELLTRQFTRGPGNASEAFKSTYAAPANCVTLPAGEVRRRIIFDQQDVSFPPGTATSTVFKLGSEVVNADGTSIDGGAGGQPHTIGPQPFQHVDPPQAASHICVKLGDQEVWEVLNYTNELHNFHIHQTKFRLARSGDRGLPRDFKEADAISDPAKVVSSQVPDFGSTFGVSKVDIWHDTLPVPPALFDKVGNRIAPGRLFLMIPFRDPAQVGTFVFHCHILEHEDLGMMATVEVYNPTNPGQSRQGADAGTPPFATGISSGFCGKGAMFFNPIGPWSTAPTAWVQSGF